MNIPTKAPAPIMKSMVKRMSEQMHEATNVQLVAAWNLLTMATVRDETHPVRLGLVKSELEKRGIRPQDGKRLKEAS